MELPIKSIIAVLLGVIVVGAVLVPIVSGLQVNVADEKQFENTAYNYFREVEDGDVLSIDYTVIDAYTGDVVWKINGTEITNAQDESPTWCPGVLSDGFIINVHESDGAGRFVSMDPTEDGWSGTGHSFGINMSHLSEVGHTYTGTCTFDDGHAVIQTYYSDGTGNNLRTYEYDYTWAYVICNEDEGTYTTVPNDTQMKATGIRNFVIAGVDSVPAEYGKIAYCYNNGNKYVSGDHTSVFAVESGDIVEGSLDVYEMNPVLTVDGTEVNLAYNVIVPLEVKGHAPTGTAYTLMGIIPVFCALALLIGIVGLYGFKKSGSDYSEPRKEE